METSTETLLRPRVGEAAPDVVIARASGEQVALSTLWQEGASVLVFLRHLGCTFCREHVTQLEQESAAFGEHGARIVLISVGSPDDTAHFCEDRALEGTFVCLSDPQKLAYQAYGLSRGSVRTLLMSPHLYARGFQAALHGHFAGMPKGDPFQMPGVFIVDKSGIVRYAHRHRDAADNPPNSDLLDVLRTL